MRFAVSLLALLSLCSSAAADIIAVRFTSPKIANRYKDHLVSRGGELVVMGEQFDDPGATSSAPGLGGGGGRVPYSLIVADPNDPTNVSYKIEIDKDGKEKIIRNKKKVVVIAAEDTVGAMVIVKDGTLATFAADYAERKREVDALLADRDSKPKGSPEWMSTHQRALMNMERLESWLRSTLYPGAADKLAKEIAKQRKLATADAVRQRKEAALASLKSVPTPPELVEVAKNISGGTDAFKVQESLHVRIIYRDTIADERVKALLTLSEEIIDSFRVEFVDPYLDPSYEDYIPEHMFAEFFFGYDDVGKQERYWTDFYKSSWGNRKDELLKSPGTGLQRTIAPYIVHYWRTDEGTNFEGIISHSLGHDLAQCHFDKRRMGMSQDWIGEGLALFVSLEWLGSNTVTCVAFKEPVAGRSTTKPKNGKEGDKTVQLGMRDFFNALALEKGAKLDKLALKTTADFEDPDIAKSWSMMDYFAKKTSREGQLFLRAACDKARTPATFINDWRAKGEEIFEIQGKDVFAHVDAAWREYAEMGQETGDTRRK